MNDCIEWQKSKDSDGYGHLWVDRKLKKAHRVAWEEANGPIPDGLCVCHRCNNKSCVNPEHLYLATHAQNIQDAYSDGLISRPEGEQHHKTTLTADDVIAIRSDTRSQTAIAKAYGITQGAVSGIVHRRTWRHM